MDRNEHSTVRGFPTVKLIIVLAVAVLVLALTWPRLRAHRTALLAENLRLAADADDRDAVVSLLKQGAPPDAWSGQTPHYCLRCKAISDEDLELAQLVFPPGAYTPETFPWHRPPFLTQAVLRDDLEMARTILDAGARINVASPYIDHTPLYEAVDTGKVAMTRLLLATARPEELRAPDDAGQSAYRILHRAVVGGSTELVTLLLDHGVPVNGLNAAGQTALDIAIMYENTDIEALLRSRVGQKGEEIRAQNNAKPGSGINPLAVRPVTHG